MKKRHLLRYSNHHSRICSDENNDKVGGAKMQFTNNKDELFTTVFSREDGFFQIDTKDLKDFYILAQKDNKVGSLKLKITPQYKTDSIITIKIINNTAIINGVVYDTNGMLQKMRW